MTEIKKEFKQGRARKINEKNFYLTMKYLHLQIQDGKRLCDEKQKNSIRGFYSEKRFNAKKNFEIQGLLEEISLREKYISSNKFPELESKADSQKKIINLHKAIKMHKKNCVQITPKELFDLHSIVAKLDDSIYKSMTSWIKQERHRRTTFTYQVTLSVQGKTALKGLKETLGAASYDETLIKLNKKIIYGDEF